MTEGPDNSIMGSSSGRHACDKDSESEDLMGSEPLEREVIGNLWGICHLVRSWAIRPDGMLERNGLMSDADARVLEDWLEDLSWRISTLLDGVDEKDAGDRDGS